MKPSITEKLQNKAKIWLSQSTINLKVFDSILILIFQYPNELDSAFEKILFVFPIID